MLNNIIEERRNDNDYSAVILYEKLKVSTFTTRTIIAALGFGGTIHTK